MKHFKVLISGQVGIMICGAGSLTGNSIIAREFEKDERPTRKIMQYKQPIMEEKQIAIEPVMDIELQKRIDTENFDAAKLSAKQRRKIRKIHGLSYSDLLRQKFREQNLERLNKK